MNISAPFIRRPVATVLVTVAVALAGLLGLTKLPAAPMPDVDLPSIYVWAHMVGASPEAMAAQVSAPLERHLGAIPGVTEITSYNKLGTTDMTVGFKLERDLNGAARDVQAAIIAALADLPRGLISRPGYFKANLADWPITYVSLTSRSMSPERLHDFATTFLKPQLASIPGVTWVYVLGSTLPAVRVELNPDALFKYGIGLEALRAALAAANPNSPKGAIEVGAQRFQIYANDHARIATDYRDLVVAYRNGRAVRLSDLGEVINSVEDFLPAAVIEGKAAILIRIYRTPGANVLATVDRIRSRLAELHPVVPVAIDMALVSDRTATIRASLYDLEQALVLAGVLVILTVLAFLKSLRAILVPAVVVPVSLLGTFGVMHLLGFSLDSLSLMALIIATGLVIDDSVVVVENISRHVENGIPSVEAALRGAQEVSFTVVAMSLSLIAAFLPLLMMGDIIGRIFRAFSVTLSAAVLISLAVSLTTAPMLAAFMLRHASERGPSRFAAIFERIFTLLLRAYEQTLEAALRHRKATLAVLAAFLGLNVSLYVSVPKGLLPQQDPGRLIGYLEADPSISAVLIRQKLDEAAKVICADPAVKSFAGVIEPEFNRDKVELYIELEPKPQRKEGAQDVIRRLSAEVGAIAGLTLRLRAPQDINFASAFATGQYQVVLKGNDIGELRRWTLRLTDALSHVPEIVDPNAEQKEGGLEARLVIDRDKASRLGISVSQIDNTLYDAFGQRPVSTIFTHSNQYRVILGVAPRYREDPDILDKLYVSTSGGPVTGVQSTALPPGTVSGPASFESLPGGFADAARNQSSNALAQSVPGAASTSAAVSTAAETMVPLSAIAHFERGAAPVSIIRKDNAIAATVSFDLAAGVPLSKALAAIEKTIAELDMPATIDTGFSGNAKVFQDAVVKQMLLIFAALATIYVVLGILYESFIHPLTILSTLPSAGVGAILALLAMRMEFTIIAFIGVILLIGIVMKNAIMMIDVALQAQRLDGLSAQGAIYKACLLRFRPIMMTTFAALFAALPLALGTGEGAELRQPLGISIIGGLLVSQVLTLYTTPAVFLTLERFQSRLALRRSKVSI